MRSVEECYRGSNVRVFRLNAESLIRQLTDCARRLIESDPHILEVRLFGSLSRGEAKPGSDADLFVLLSDGDAASFSERIPPLLSSFADAPIGCEVIAYTESEYDQAKRRGDRFIEELERDGRTLAAVARRGSA